MCDVCRLRYHDPLLQEDPPLVEDADSEPSPRRQQWLDDVKTLTVWCRYNLSNTYTCKVEMHCLICDKMLVCDICHFIFTTEKKNTYVSMKSCVNCNYKM